MQPTINILHSTEINATLWNNTVAKNANGLIYANFEYLSFLCPNWFAIIINNYETILPLPIKTKFNIKYTYMPAFVQQLGFIGNNNCVNDNVIATLQNFVSYGTPHFNFSNTAIAQQLKCKALNNYIINLQNDYTTIAIAYKKSTHYSIKKAAKQAVMYTEDSNIDQAVKLYKKYNQENLPHVTDKDYAQLKKLLHTLYKKEHVVIRKVINQHNELLSLVLLLKDNKRLYNLINFTTVEGRNCDANYFLYDKLFQEFALQPLLFDFEGSDLPGVKKFYEKFGAINQPYFSWHFNKLPLPLRWLKK